MYNPKSTYRIQFQKEFTFAQMRQHLDYIFMLGPSTIYASPVFEAVPGSTHGYDVTNPLEVNPEIGTYDDFVSLSLLLKENETGWLQDIVPNHMAFHMNNLWLRDVLGKGPASKYAGFFDIDFNHPGLRGKLSVPFLGKPAGEAINDGELQVVWSEGSFSLKYFDTLFPCNSKTFIYLLKKEQGRMPAQFSQTFADIAHRDINIEDDEWTGLKKRVEDLHAGSAEFRKLIGSVIDRANSDREALRIIHGMQHYDLSFWKESSRALNYRRFFTVNGLICLKMEGDRVFDEWHTFVAREVKSRRFNGLRIDHIDGLRNPSQYAEKLRLLTGEETYIVAEKILGHEEVMPGYLPLQGTSGYDYLGIVNNLLWYRENDKLLKEGYRELTGMKEEVSDVIYARKKHILAAEMGGEWENLTRLFEESGLVQYSGGVTRETLKSAICEFLVLFPVYKIYSDYLPVSHEDSLVIGNALDKAAAKNPSLREPLDILRKVFLDPDPDKMDESLNLMLRCMQFTGPLMAKGVEDTTMYYYNASVVHNEVGDHPGSQGISADKYHQLMLYRQKYSPMSMNATSTHDTKRGEDARARLNVISEMPGEWRSQVKSWMDVNSSFRSDINGKTAPDANEEYFLYQNMIAVFPFSMIPDDELKGRLEEYIIKALREGKTNSNWNDPDEEYERAVVQFMKKILEDGSSFLKEFRPFLGKVISYGIINSLSQLMLKAASPGIPDFYQGTELWDLSLVDPDNRRPVDYDLRKQMLTGLIAGEKENPESFYESLWREREDGRIKLWLTHRLLTIRKSEPDLFLHGRYLPLETTGRHAGNVIAFARVHENSWCVVAAPLHMAVGGMDALRPGMFDWGDTTIVFPDSAPSEWTPVAGSEELKLRGKVLVSEIMPFVCPVMLLAKKPVQKRFAGVLAHVSSLPGKYGVGDLGHEAYDFADMLASNGQKFWQILPLNPIGEGNGWSPYSSISAFAGNTMFINPDLLEGSGLLSRKGLNAASFGETGRAAFTKAAKYREMFLDEAYTAFFCRDIPYRKWKFEEFCVRESHWLDDFSLFTILKREHGGESWNRWPARIRNRNAKVLAELSAKHENEIKLEKFAQFIFQEQWAALRQYCNNAGIKLIGDMSFYVNYDSADVWSHPGLFSIDKRKRPVMVAGVPPDYFSKDGQLWNMPVYNWEKMKEAGYRWWIDRIRRNVDFCDVVRFDHFRGFSGYWEVPSGEKTAVNGKWTAGPADDFFARVKSEFPGMPFIAEDLGSIDDKVYKLRDDFGLPGMAVLQFSFGDDTPYSPYIGHNHRYNSIVYTGTHDNNTTKGWYLNELDEENRRQAEEYLGHAIWKDRCHEEFIRMAYASVGRIAIIPVQDLMGLDESARLNKPSTSEKNWDWKLKKEDTQKIFTDIIRKLMKIYGRV